jgi:hypothetical protein
MNRYKPILTILAIGSLWGLLEIMPLPTGILCAGGILFLVLGRKLWNAPGTSIATGFVVCLFKIGGSTFICQWVGVLSLAVSFDICASLLWRKNEWNPVKIALLGFLSSLAGVSLFVVWAMVIAQQPSWVAGGWERVMSYAWQIMLPSTSLSLILAPAGYLIGARLTTAMSGSNGC